MMFGKLFCRKQERTLALLQWRFQYGQMLHIKLETNKLNKSKVNLQIETEIENSIIVNNLL